MMRFFEGIHYFIVGLKLLTRSGLRRFVVIPGVINLLLYTLFFYVSRHYIGAFNEWFNQFLPAWLHWLSVVLWISFFLCFIFFFIYTVVLLGNLVCAPFNSFLAEKVELCLTGRLLAPRSLLDNIRDIPRIVGRQLCLLGYYIPRALLLLILLCIPVLQVLAALAWVVFHAWLLTLTYLDYPTDNHRIPLSEVHRWLRARPGLALGFGASILVASAIPVLNLISIPAAVAGATALWLDEKRSS